jgi:PTS system cellobiose-specific IIA component
MSEINEKLENNEENELTMVAMKIIINAGDARTKAREAVKYAKQFEFEKAKILMNEAYDFINLAHTSQTEVIQNEAGGKSYDLSLLFVHAQDTLMTIKSELSFASDVIDLVEMINKKS